MKIFTIQEKVPVMHYRTITIQAESAEDAVHKYLNDNDFNYNVHTESDEEWDNAEIMDVTEEPDNQ